MGDVAFSFMIGTYRPDGTIELDFHRIARQYAKSWFVFDLIVVANDWVTTAVIWASGDKSQSGGSLRMAKVVRLSRNLRMARLLRLIKLREMMVAFFEGTISSEEIR